MNSSVAITVATQLAAQPEQQQQVEVARRVGDDGLQPLGPAPPVTRRLLGAHPWRRASAPSPRWRSARRPRRGRRPTSSHPGRSPLELRTSRHASSSSCLQAEHLLVLLGLGVVVAEQVQDAVRAQQLQLRPGCCARPRPPALAATCGHSTTSPSSAGSVGTSASSARPAAAAAARPWGRPARRSGPARPSTARAARPWRPRRRPAIGQLGQRVDAHLVRARAGPARPGRLVDLDAGLVVDLDAHRRSCSLPRRCDALGRLRRLLDRASYRP